MCVCVCALNMRACNIDLHFENVKLVSGNALQTSHTIGPH